MLTKSHEKRTHRSLSHERWSTDGNPTKKALRPSRRFTSLNERNPASVNWMATTRLKVVLTTQVLLLKSLESNGDRRNYLSSWEENVERRLAVVSEGPTCLSRNTEVLDSGHSGRRSDLWIGPLRWTHLASFPQHMLSHRHVDEVTWKVHSQVTVTRTMEHRLQSNKLTKKLSDLPAASFLWTNGTPRQSTEWRSRDRKWFNHSCSALEKSGSNGDRRNYLSSWEENVERRLAVVSEGSAWAETRRSRILDIQAIWSLDGAAAMNSPGFFFIERPRFVELPQAREWVSTATGQPERQTSVDLGVQRRETADKVRTNDRHYCFIDSTCILYSAA